MTNTTTSLFDAYAIWDTQDLKWWIGKNAAYHTQAAAKNSWNSSEGHKWEWNEETKKHDYTRTKFQNQTRYVVKKVQFVPIDA